MKTKILFAIAGICLMTLISGRAQAESLGNFFDPKVSYDIYVAGGEGELSTISDVEIIKMVEIAGRDFLVVRRAGFSFSSEEGYIPFEHIRAILPNRKIKIPNTQSIKVRTD